MYLFSFVGICSAILLCVFAYAGVQTALMFRSVQQGRFESAQLAAQRAQPFTHFLSILTAGHNPDLTAWHDSLVLMSHASDDAALVQKYLRATLQKDNQAVELATHIKDMSEHWQKSLAQLNDNIDHSIFVKKIIFQKRKLSSANSLHDVLVTYPTEINTVIQYFLSGTHRYLILFQNSDELRATGGFAGSYALVELREGALAQLDIQDIYEPDGQFQGYVEPPPGVREYLSSGHGLRLPDANWNADFPASANTILSFFAQGKQQNIDGVIAINLTVAENVLRVVGDTFLPDYGITVTPENLSVAARNNRDQFFPGSRQKQNLLGHLFTQLKIKISELPREKHVALLQLLRQELKNKNIQVFSTAEDIEELAQKYQVAGTLTFPTDTAGPLFPLMLVESNVGINKANKLVTRKVQLIPHDDHMHMNISFTNNNLKPTEPPSTPQERNGNGYVNYLRVLLPAETTIKDISIAGTPITRWDETSVITTTQQPLKQIGFLVTVPEQQTKEVNIELQSPLLAAHPQFFIMRQSGLPPTPYTIAPEHEGQPHTFLLEKDELIPLTATTSDIHE